MCSEICNKCSKNVQSFNTHLKCSVYSATYYITRVHMYWERRLNHWKYLVLHVDDDYVFIEIFREVSLDCSYRIHDFNKKIFVPFKINDGSPFHLTDPVKQFSSGNHYIQSTSCDYHLEDYFNNKANLRDLIAVIVQVIWLKLGSNHWLSSHIA